MMWREKHNAQNIAFLAQNSVQKTIRKKSHKDPNQTYYPNQFFVEQNTIFILEKSKLAAWAEEKNTMHKIWPL